LRVMLLMEPGRHAVEVRGVVVEGLAVLVVHLPARRNRAVVAFPDLAVQVFDTLLDQPAIRPAIDPVRGAWRVGIPPEGDPLEDDGL
jgi:hypothetical protein